MTQNRIDTQGGLSSQERNRLLLVALIYGSLLFILFFSWRIGRQQLATFHNNQGIAQEQAGNPTEAILSFTKAIELNSSSAEAYYNRGWVHYEQDNLEKAIQDYSMAINLDATFAQAYRDRGIAFQTQSELQEYFGDIFEFQRLALADFDRSLELNPNDALSYFARGVTHAASYDYEEAISDYSQAIELEPEYAAAYLHRGIVKTYIFGGFPLDPEGALVDFDRALEMGSTDPVLYYNRGKAYLWLSENANAIADFDTGLEITPNDSRLYQARALAHQVDGNLEAALADYQLYLEVNPDAYDRERIEETIASLTDDLANE